MKPLFSEKVQTSSDITLVENGSLISDDFQVAEIMNDYFVNITETLGISKDAGNVSPIIEDTDPVERALRKHRSHPSIQRIRANVSQANEFDFQKTSVMEVEQQIRKLKPKMATPYGRVPAKILKQNSDIFSDYLTSFFNNMVECCEFPGELKEGEITSLFKNQDALTKKNYRPITILTSESKIFERIMYDQIKLFFPFSHYLCGFREGYSTQHALLRLLETCKEFLDKKGYVGAVLMDLSKALDCLDHDLLLAKLDAYGFGRNALILICNYLSDRRQRVKVNGTFSTWCYSKIGVPQGSVLVPLLFNIFINDIFYLVNDTEVCNYADDTTLYVGDKNLRTVLSKLEKDTLLLSDWFSDNFMKLNEDKSHLLIFGTKSDGMTLSIAASQISESESEKLLGVTIDSKLNFNLHFTQLCVKASQKLHALARVSNYMDTEKVKLIMRSFIMSHFSYCPLIWMFHDRATNSRINKIHERALRIVYRDTESSFDELLAMDNSVSVHQRNLQLLMIEIYKTKNNLNPSFMEDIFVERPNIPSTLEIMMVFWYQGQIQLLMV